MTFAAVEWSQGVENAWNDVATFVPRFLVFLVVLVAGYFIAKALSKVVDKVLERVGFDKAVERGGVRKALSRSEYDASDLMSKLVYYTVMLFVLQFAFGVFGPNPVSELLDSVVSYLPKVIVAVAIVVIFASIAAAAREMIDASIGGLSYGRTVANAAAGVLVAVGVIAALNQLEIARDIVNGIFYAALAMVVGVTIVAVGGGGIRPMQQVWQNALTKVSEESGKIRQEAAGASERMKARAEERARQAQEQPVDAQAESESRIDVRDETVPTATEPWSSGTTQGGTGRNPQGF